MIDHAATHAATPNFPPTAAAADPAVQHDAMDALTRMLRAARSDIERPTGADRDSDASVARLMVLAHELIPEADGCAIAVARVGSPIRILSGCDDRTAMIIEAQLSAAEGPALELLGRHGTACIADARTDLRWPRVCPALAKLGALSMAAADLPITARSRGVVVICASRPDAFGVVAGTMLPILASRISLELRRSDHVGNLTQAIERRQFVGQAIGILMERHRIGSEAAFQRLIEASQRRNVKLHVIAQGVIETGQEPSDVFG